MPAEEVKFENQQGQLLLAQLENPANKKPKAYALFAHCLGSAESQKAAIYISHALCQAGIAVLRFDANAIDEKGSDKPPYLLNASDLEAAAAFLKKEYKAPQLLIGHSLGGTAVLLASPRISSVQASITINTPFKPQDITQLFQEDTNIIDREGKVVVDISGYLYTLRKQLLDDLIHFYEQVPRKKLNKPLLLMHSSHDKVVSLKNASEIYQNSLQPKSFISLDEADHLLSEHDDVLFVADMISAWVRKYVKVKQPTKLATDKQLVTRTQNSFITEIMTDEHALLADEPLEVGGSDLGPSPYELLTASLGACTGMTLRMYADHKKWPLREVRVHLQHQKTHAQDCEDCEDDSQKIDRIERLIELEGDLTKDQKQRLLEIADKCPVHKTLHSPTEVVTTLGEDL